MKKGHTPSVEHGASWPVTWDVEMKRPQKWIIGHGGADSADHLVYLSDDEIRQRDARNRKLDDEASRKREKEDAEYRDYEERQRRKNQPQPLRTDFTFAKSCNIPLGQTCYPAKAPLDSLSTYGTLAVLGRGREFSSFDAFRKAFWIEVSQISALVTQFTRENKLRMNDGLAPHARYKDSIGMRKVFELHHIERISDGGEVYNVDNLRVSTPKNHVDIHRKVVL